MRKLARIFGFGEERRTADAARSKRQSSAIAQSRAARRRPEMVRENLQTNFSKHDSKQQAKHEASSRHILITNSKQDLVGVLGMGGATKKLKNAMLTRPSLDVPRATESGVFVTGPRAIDLTPLESSPVWPAEIDTRAIEEVTLIVYGWENVQPGTLSWVFPSLRSALSAVRAMRNAVRWAVLDGAADDDAAKDVESARESGRVLVEA